MSVVTLRKFSDSILVIWNESTPAARIGLIILTIACVVLVSLVGFWSAQPRFVTLTSDIAPDKMANVVDALDKAGIKYEVGGAGGVLRVDSRSFAKARLVARGQGISAEETESQAVAGGMWLDPTDRKNLEVRKKESSLAMSIKKFSAVESADVHLNVPAKGPFQRRVSDPSASVLLTLTQNAKRLTDENILAIASLVAFAIEDLQPEAVRIADKDGNVYPVPDEMSGNINSQIEFTTQLERKLTRKAESMLTKFLGYGNATVQVSANMTFKRSETHKNEVDAEGKVVQQEELETTNKTTEELDTSGAGVTANTETAPAAGVTGTQDKTEKIISTYVIPQSSTSEIDNTPERRSMTVSVLVNATSPAVQDENGTLLPDMSNRIEQIVRTAVGFQEDSDAIWVEFQPFPSLEGEETVSAPFNWEQVNEILRNVSLAIAALVALFLGFMTLRRFQKQSVANSVQVAPDQASSINQLNELAKSNPEVFTRILQSWAGSKKEQDNSDLKLHNRKAA